jgi:hypothetical protein
LAAWHIRAAFPNRRTRDEAGLTNANAPIYFTKLQKRCFERGAPLTERTKVLGRLTPIQAALAGLLLLLLLLQIAIIVLLLRTNSATQPLVDRSEALAQLADGGPYLNQDTVRQLLGLAGAELAELADSRIQYTVHISQTVPITTDVLINEQITVPISLQVNRTIPIKTEIPIRKQVLVPVNLEIDQVIAIDTTVPFKDQLVVPVNDVIEIDEVFETSLLGQTVNFPVRGAIPIQLDVVVPIDKEFPIQTDIPVRFPISQTLLVDLNWTVPIDLDIPVNLPIETEVVVPIYRNIPISVEIPVVLDVPIDIAIGDTPLGAYLRRIGDQLP